MQTPEKKISIFQTEFSTLLSSALGALSGLVWTCAAAIFNFWNSGGLHILRMRSSYSIHIFTDNLDCVVMQLVKRMQMAIVLINHHYVLNSMHEYSTHINMDFIQAMNSKS